ncbi:Fatty acid synthase beta subunit aflB, partial [Dissostichus eleginoides]
MAAAFTADYEGLYSIHKKAVGVVCDSTQQNQEPHSKVNQQEQMDGKDKLSWRRSALARPSSVKRLGLRYSREICAIALLLEICSGIGVGFPLSSD